MKHKFWIVLLAIVATLCMAFGLAGCEEKNEQPGGNTDGIEEENVGTEGLCYTEMYGKDGKTLIGYSVGAGEAADEEEIVIPSKHNDLPVLSISRSEDDTEFWNEFYESSNRLTTAEEYDALIQKYTFCYCANLKKITIPKSIISIEKGAFSSCENLEEVHISDLAAWCNIKFGGARATPLTYARHLFIDGKEITQLEIPSSVTSIGNYVFEGCSGLTGELKIPSSVTSIGVHVFNRIRDTAKNQKILLKQSLSRA